MSEKIEKIIKENFPETTHLIYKIDERYKEGNPTTVKISLFKKIHSFKVIFKKRVEVYSEIYLNFRKNNPEIFTRHDGDGDCWVKGDPEGAYYFDE